MLLGRYLTTVYFDNTLYTYWGVYDSSKTFAYSANAVVGEISFPCIR